MMGIYKGFLLMVLLFFTCCMEPSEQMDSRRQGRRSSGESRRQTGSNSHPPSTLNRNHISLNTDEEHTLLENYQRVGLDSSNAIERFAEINTRNGVLPDVDQRLLFNLAGRLHRRREEQGLPNINWAQGHESEIIEFYLRNPRLIEDPRRFYRHWRRAFADLPDIGDTQLLHEVHRLIARQDVIRARRALERHQRTSQHGAHSLVNVTNSPYSGSWFYVESGQVHSLPIDHQGSTSRESETFDAPEDIPRFPHNQPGPR